MKNFKSAACSAWALCQREPSVSVANRDFVQMAFEMETYA